MTIEVNCPACGSDRNGHHHKNTRRCNDCDNTFDWTLCMDMPNAPVDLDALRETITSAMNSPVGAFPLAGLMLDVNKALDELEALREDLAAETASHHETLSELERYRERDRREYDDWLRKQAEEHRALRRHPLYPERAQNYLNW